MKLPQKRVKSVNFRKYLLNLLVNSKFSEFINVLFVLFLELFFTFYNSLTGKYSKPDNYLDDLVEFSKKSNMTQKVAIVTGANSGIGYATTKYLYKAGYYIILACRSEQKALEAIKKIEADGSGGKLKFIKLDLNSLVSVKEFVAEFEKLDLKLDLLVNNAGVLSINYEETAENFESHFGVNFVGQYVLTDLLIPHLRSPSAIINVTSITAFYANNFDLPQLTQPNLFHPRKNYSQSKLAVILFTYYLQDKLQSENISVFAIHPGMVESDLLFKDPAAKLLSSFGNLFIKNVLTGTFTILRCALLPLIDDHFQSSLFFMEENPFPPHKEAHNQERIDELINYTRETLGAKGIKLTSI